jgi:hypothetical protein
MDGYGEAVLDLADQSVNPLRIERIVGSPVGEK